MDVKEHYQGMYKSQKTPWDIGKPDFNLIEVVTKTPIKSCNALEIGCGTGDNSIWLAENHFQVTGIEASKIALEKARRKASERHVDCDFYLADFFSGSLKDVSFGFVFDRGCFHSFQRADERERFARKVADHLTQDGFWLTLAGNADEDRRVSGPPQLSATDIVRAAEPFFEIMLLETSRFASNGKNPPRAWKCLMKKRHGL